MGAPLNPISRVGKAIYAIFFLALLVRVWNLDIPFVEPYNNISRQSLCASVARNFYQHGFNLFYPEIDENGPGPYLYNVEFPLYSYVMAVGYKLAGGVREWAARLVSVFFGMLFLFFLYFFLRRVSSETVAFWGVVFASFSPMCVALSRSIQPDITMLSASMVALYAFYRFKETEEPHFYIFSLLALSLAVLTRPFALYLFLPIVAIAWMNEGKDIFKNPKNYVFAFSVLLTLTWYVWMAVAGKGQKLAYDPYIFSRGDMAEHHDYLRLFAPSKLIYPAKILVFHLLTPLGSLLALRGIFARPRNWKEIVIYPWLMGVIIYLLVAWPTAVSHSYYFLPLLSIFAFWVGKGVEALLESERTAKIVKNPIVIILALVMSLVSAGYFYRLLYFIPDERWAIVRTAETAQKITPKEDLVVASWGSSPIQLYYCNRKGWVLNLEDKDTKALIEKLEAHRAQGAKWFVTSKTADIRRNLDFEKYLLSRYKAVFNNQESLVVDLRVVQASEPS